MPRLRILHSPPMSPLSIFFPSHWHINNVHVQSAACSSWLFSLFLQELVVVLRIYRSTFVFNRNESACREGASWKKKNVKKEDVHTSECCLKFARLFEWPTTGITRYCDRRNKSIGWGERGRERERVEGRFFIAFVRNLFRHFYELKNNINKRMRCVAQSADFLLAFWLWLSIFDFMFSFVLLQLYAFFSLCLFQFHVNPFYHCWDLMKHHAA